MSLNAFGKRSSQPEVDRLRQGRQRDNDGVLIPWRNEPRIVIPEIAKLLKANLRRLVGGGERLTPFSCRAANHGSGGFVTTILHGHHHPRYCQTCQYQRSLIKKNSYNQAAQPNDAK